MKRIDEFLSSKSGGSSLSLQERMQGQSSLQRDAIYRTFADDLRAIELDAASSPLVKWVVNTHRSPSGPLALSRTTTKPEVAV